MVGYHISIGYNGATGIDYSVAWKTLKRVSRQVCDDPAEIIAEARRLGAPEQCERGCCTLESHTEVYRTSFETSGHPVSIIENENDPENYQVMQLASSGDAIKYHVRRAFVRLVIESMHREGIEVSLTVV